MMAKEAHTPGPWGIYRQPLRGRLHACWELARLVFGTTSFVRSMPMIVGEDQKCSAVTGCGERSEANARLIAAAPELLEALDKAVAFYDNLSRPHDEGETKLLDEMAAATAKARGEA